MGRIQERRIHERYNLHLPARIEYEGVDCDNMELIKLINISAGGAFFPMGMRPKIEQQIKLDIAAGNLLGMEEEKASTVKANGLVKRIESCSGHPGNICVAVEFEGPVRIIQA